MSKIFLISNSNHLFQFIKESVTEINFQVDLFLPEELNFRDKDISQYTVVIFDGNALKSSQMPDPSAILKQITETHLPLLVLLPDQNSILRSWISNIPTADYLYYPFDKTDLQFRLNKMLQNRQAEQTAPPPQPNIDRSLSRNIQELLSDPIHFNYEFSIKSLLYNLYKNLDLDIIAYFELEKQGQVRIKFSYGNISLPTGWRIPVQQFPIFTEAIQHRSPLFFKKLTKSDPIYLQIKSYFNLDVSSAMVLPIVVAHRTKSLVVVFQSHGKFLTSQNFDVAREWSDVISSVLCFQENFVPALSGSEDHKWRTSFQFIDHVINHLNFGIVIINTDKVIKYLNRPAANLLAIEPEAALQKTLPEVIGEENCQTIFESLEQKDGTFERPELRLEKPNGDSILVSFTITNFKDRGNRHDGYIISLNDITYSKELQEEMRRMDRLASLGVMASGIAHEIRNPLAGIKAIAQTFEEELDHDDPKAEFVKRIIKQVNRLDKLLKTLFSYAKPQKPNRQFISIQHIIQDVIPLLKQNLYKNQIKLTQTFAPDLPDLYIDAGQIQQVIFNLLLNSIQAIEGKGEIQVHVTPVTPQLKKFERKPFFRKITENPYLLIHISDTGKGIEPENLQQIFNPFFTTKTFGTGLGLSIVYQIVKENDGIIYFESEVNKGTDCYLFLPAFEPSK